MIPVANAAAQAVYKADLNDVYKLIADLALVREAITLTSNNGLSHLLNLFVPSRNRLKQYLSYMNSFLYPLNAPLLTSLLISEDSGHTHALQRSDVQPNSGRGAGRGGRSTPYVKVFVDPSFIPPAGTKNCWFHGYKGQNGSECRNIDLTLKNAKTHSEIPGRYL